MQITTYTAPRKLGSDAHFAPARSSSEIVDRIRDATASVKEVGLFLRALKDVLEPADLKIAEYALARARYRAGDAVSLKQLALLAEVSVEVAARYLSKCNKSADHECISNRDAGAVLCNIVEF